MTDYKEFGKKRINGVQRIIYTKPGSKKQYLKYKGRMMNIVKYKKLLAKKAEPKNTAKKTAKKSKMSKRHGKKRGGGDDDITNSDSLKDNSSVTETFNSALKQINLFSSSS